MERLEVHDAEVAWYPEARVLELRFRAPSHLPEETARAIRSAARRWVGRPPRPFAFLVDCANIRDTTPGWRAVWGEFFLEHAPFARMAWFNANAIIRATILIFQKGTGVEGRLFDTEEEARAWLRSSGVAA